MMKEKGWAKRVLVAYGLFSAVTLGHAFWFWEHGGPMKDMANGLNLMFSFGFVCILTLFALVAMVVSRAGLRIYAMGLGIFLVWVGVMIYYLGDEISTLWIPRGHYYSVRYRNHSPQDIFVDGVGDLKRSMDLDSGTRTVYYLPKRIVWWNGRDWRKAVPTDWSHTIVPPPDLQWGDAVIFTLNGESEWETKIERFPVVKRP